MPTRYQVTTRARLSFSPWNAPELLYCISQLQIGYNPLSNLQVVSSLNTLSESSLRYHYNYQNCTSRYYPKVYIGTSQTIAAGWNMDLQNTSKPPANQWPQNFGQTSQKGEAIINFVCNLMLLIIRFGSDKPIVNDNQTF